MSDDKRLKQAVLDELQWEPSVNAAHIGVTAKDGIITLMGHVENFSEKSAAEKAARRVKDVRAVAEEIEVRLPFSVKHGDEEIASAAVNRLQWDSTFPNGAVKAKVEKGWVTLTGEVDWHYQQEAAATMFADFGASSAFPTRSPSSQSRTHRTSETKSWSHWIGRGSIPRQST